MDHLGQPLFLDTWPQCTPGFFQYQRPCTGYRNQTNGSSTLHTLYLGPIESSCGIIWLGCSNKYCFEAWAHNCALIEMCAQLCAHLPLSEPFETHTINGHHCMVWANPTYPTHETLQLGPILSLYIFSQVILSKGHLHCTQTKWVHKCALIFCRRGLSLHENTACNATAGRPGRAQATKHESPEVR